MNGLNQGTETKKFSVKRSYSGLGLYSNVPIKKNKFVIEYTGKLLTNQEVESIKNNKYLFELNTRWTVDGSERKNISRYINHCCRPNCEPRIMGRQVKIYAIRNIEPRDELTYNYGKVYFNEYIKPHGCKCSYCKSKKN